MKPTRILLLTAATLLFALGCERHPLPANKPRPSAAPAATPTPKPNTTQEPAPQYFPED